MGFSYNKLWKLLIDKNMKKTDLQCAIATRPKTIAKMGKDEYLQVDLISSCISTALVLQFILQQAMEYAKMLDVPFAYSSNSDGFIEHDFLHVTLVSNSIIYFFNMPIKWST